MSLDAPGRTPRRRCLPVVGTVAAVAVVLWRTVSVGSTGAADHFTYDRTVRYMQGGAGYYDAMRRAFADLDTTIGHARAFRGPLIFLFWQVLPRSWLYGAFLVLVVVLTTYLFARASWFPWAALPAGLYLVLAGRVPWGGAADLRETWMLVEYWTVPILAGALLCWRRRAWWGAAALVLLAALTREIAAPVLVGGLVAAHLGHLPRRPWLAGLGAFGALFALHLWVATGYTDPPGNDAVLLGTGAPPETVLDMTAWLLPGGILLGVALWLAAVVGLYRDDRIELVFVGPLLALPLTGLVVDRPYWGIVVVPFTLFYVGELLGREVTRGRRRVHPPVATNDGGPGAPTDCGDVGDERARDDRAPGRVQL